MALLAEDDSRIVLAALACAAAASALCRTSAYCRGWRQTLSSALSVQCNRESFASRHSVEEFPCSDGEVGVVWWPLPSTRLEEEGGAGTPERHRHLWVLLPGGMCNAAAGYVDDALASGVFGGADYCAFHNPGIESRVVNRVSPPVKPPLSLLSLCLTYCLSD